MRVSDYKNCYQKNLIDPLSKMPTAQLKLLDSNHDQCVMSFQNAIGQLYAPPGPFAGQAANALGDLVALYYSAENGVSTYDNDGLSERVGKLMGNEHEQPEQG